jgi:predicted PurR-regulated permease PerM
MGRPYASLFTDSARVVGLYIRGQLMIAGIEMMFYAIGFAIVRVPLWPVVAFCCGLLYLVPAIGSVIALGLAALVAWLGGGDLWKLGEVAAVWLIIQTLEGFVITPRIIGRRLGLRPWLVFLVVLIGGALFGPLGVILAAPVVAIANVFLQFFRPRRVSGDSPLRNP